MKLRNPGWALILPTVVLLGVVAAQGLNIRRTSPLPREPHVAHIILADPPGWRVRDVPLGPSEFMSNEVEKVLNYDEVVNREYTRESGTFSVYVAYWSAGKMSAQLVASHTPDRCWTENGWRCLEMKFKQAKAFEGVTLQPAEWRLFEPPLGGRPTYVLYWHLVEGRIYDYGERFNNIPDPVRWWKDALQQILLGGREQYFIRLTSNEPIENLWHDPGFAEVLRGLGRLGLIVKTPVGIKNQ